jgi:aryl-alcohol dehydrogenase-like predicted oxidoreductase
MKTTTLGQAGLQVSRIAFGTAEVSPADQGLDDSDKIMTSAAPVAGPSPEGMA